MQISTKPVANITLFMCSPFKFPNDTYLGYPPEQFRGFLSGLTRLQDASDPVTVSRERQQKLCKFVAEGFVWNEFQGHRSPHPGCSNLPIRVHQLTWPGVGS